MPHRSRATPRAVPAVDHAPEGAQRTLTDERGRVWTVREDRTPHTEWSAADTDNAAHGYGVGWLMFELGADTRKRLRLYPTRWDRLSEKELQRLCGRARGF